MVGVDQANPKAYVKKSQSKQDSLLKQVLSVLSAVLMSDYY